MKTIACAVILVLSLISITAPVLTSAQSGGRTASGAYRFVLDDDLAKAVEFSAQTDERGATTGQMRFTDEARISNQDGEDGDPREEPPAQFVITAAFDALTIDRNRAVMSGVITDSSHSNYVGKWVQLIVEDNGEGADQVNWRFCPEQPGGWVPADAEDPRDEGAYWHWWATDAERRDDVGVASRSVIPGETRGCESVSLGSYEFAEVRGEGEIMVRP